MYPYRIFKILTQYNLFKPFLSENLRHKKKVCAKLHCNTFSDDKEISVKLTTEPTDPG